MKNRTKIHKIYDFYGKVFQADNDSESNSHKWTDGLTVERMPCVEAWSNQVICRPEEVSKIRDPDPDEQNYRPFYL